jgi:hypothetical protein
VPLAAVAFFMAVAQRLTDGEQARTGVGAKNDCLYRDIRISKLQMIRL